jgi:hypothetical protein
MNSLDVMGDERILQRSLAGFWEIVHLSSSRLVTIPSGQETWIDEAAATPVT